MTVQMLSLEVAPVACPAPMAIAKEELAWFRQLGRMSEKAARFVRPKGGEAKAAPQSGSAFELADAMELGLAQVCTQGLTAGFMAPAPQEEPMQRCVVTRSADRTEHVLESESGERLMVARGSREGRVEFFLPIGGEPALAVGPAFTLAPEGRGCDKTWTLFAERCEGCQHRSAACSCSLKAGRRELARVRHFNEEIGLGSAKCMEVELPELHATKLSLASRRPKWNSRLQSLTLDFRGRCKLASAKNFQLDLAGEDRRPKQEAELLFGKVDDDSFVLDYKHPFSMAQAFAIALTARGWH